MPWGTRQFTGAMPSMAPRQLEAHQATFARNCWFDGKTIRPIPELRRTGIMFGMATRTIWRFDEDRWFKWDMDVDVVRAPVRDDIANRIMWTGDGAPKQTTEAIMQGGGFTSPGTPRGRTLGIPAPPHAATIAFDPTDPVTNVVADGLQESHVYIYTFVSDLDEEGPPSPPSLILDRGFKGDGNLRRTVITMATSSQGDHGANRKRIYRSATSINGAATTTNYRLLAEVPITQATYTDSTQTAHLGQELVSTFWDAPPADLVGLLAIPNGVLAGFKGRDVYLSEPLQPHAWPTDYIHTVEDPVVGLGAFGTTIVVLTTGAPWLIAGSHPGSTTMGRMEFNQSCVAKRSISYIDLQGVAYASPDGIVVVGPHGGVLASKELYERADWRALNPAQFRTVYQDGAYVAFTDTQAVAFDPTQGGVVVTDDAQIRAVWHDRERDSVWVITSTGELAEWDTDLRSGDTPRLATWRSRVEPGPLRTYAAVQVIGAPLTHDIFIENAPGKEQIFTRAAAGTTPAAPFDGWGYNQPGLSSGFFWVRTMAEATGAGDLWYSERDVPADVQMGAAVTDTWTAPALVSTATLDWRMMLHHGDGTGRRSLVVMPSTPGDPLPVRLPQIDIASHWQYEIATKREVLEVRLGVMRDMVG